MSLYEKICTILIRFVAVILSVFGIFAFITLLLMFANISYSEKHTYWEVFHSAIFYFILGIVLFLLSKPLAKLICINLEK